MGGKQGLRFYADIILKIALLVLGISDFIGILPPSLDAFDKVITGLILFYFWIKLKPLNFMLGYRSKSLSLVVIGVFYLFVIDTFVAFFNISQEFSLRLSVYSITLGMILIALIALYVSFRKIHRNSMFHSFFSFIDQKGTLWKRLDEKKFVPLKFILFFLVMIFTSQYFFGLINQWFIVSLDKSLLIMAFLFAIKDIKSEKSKFLNSLGDFDEKLLGMVTSIFTDRKRFYLGLGVLLVFHYLSDLALFFIPYLLPIPKEGYYFNLLGRPELHIPMRELLAAEQGGFLAWLSYFVSSLGAIFLILIPIILLFLIVLKKDIKKMIHIKGSNIVLSIVSGSIVVYLLSMWVYPSIILTGHLVGVDFLTRAIGGFSFLNFRGLMLVFFVVFFVSIFFRKKTEEAAWTAVFGVSLVYLSVYSLYYFISLGYYYLYNVIPYFAGNIPMVVNSYVLLGLDFVFYVLGLVIFAYNAMRYVLKNIAAGIITNKFIIVVSFAVIFATIIIVHILEGVGFVISFTILFSFLGMFLIFSYSLFKEMQDKKEFRDDFILAIGMIEFMYLGLGALIYLLALNFGLSIGFMNYLVPFGVWLIALCLARFFGLKFSFRGMSFRRMVWALLIGLGFGVLFWLLNEPSVELFTSNIALVLLFIVFVAFSEEFIYRLVLFKLAEKSFDFRTANIVQALVFALVHFLFVKQIYMHYSSLLMFAGYFLGLVVFGYVMGLIVGRAERGGERDVLYAIVAHIVANVFVFLI